MPISRIRRWFVRLGPHTSFIGLVIMSYGITPLAGAVVPQANFQTWGTRDFITLLIGLLITVLGAFFAGAKRELERMVAESSAHVTRLEKQLDAVAEESAGLLRLLLTNYTSKADITAQLDRMETLLARDMAALNHRLDQISQYQRRPEGDH